MASAACAMETSKSNNAPARGPRPGTSKLYIILESSPGAKISSLLLLIPLLLIVIFRHLRFFASARPSCPSPGRLKHSVPHLQTTLLEFYKGRSGDDI